MNGFLTIPNFIVHPKGPREEGAFSQQTDVDVPGVRFPFRAENRARPMPDHELFMAEQRRPMVVPSEVKTVQCRLNGTWTDLKLENMQKVLGAGAFHPPDLVETIAKALYQTGIWEDDGLVVRIELPRKMNRREVECFSSEKGGGVTRWVLKPVADGSEETVTNLAALKGLTAVPRNVSNSS